MKRQRPRFIVLSLLMLMSAPLQAAQHLIKVVEIYQGPLADAEAQYVVLQMYSAGQNQLQGHSVNVYGATDSLLGTFTFNAAVPNASNQDKILIASSAAQARFNIDADLLMMPVLPAAGGKVCFDAFDCVSWGNYMADAVNPSPSGNPFSPVDGLMPDTPYARSTGANGTLENQDDSNDSATDFGVVVFAAPTNNAGEVGAVMPTIPGPMPDSGGSGGGGGNLSAGTLLWLSLLAILRLWLRRRPGRR